MSIVFLYAMLTSAVVLALSSASVALVKVLMVVALATIALLIINCIRHVQRDREEDE
jgi:hypothetical protein